MKTSINTLLILIIIVIYTGCEDNSINNSNENIIYEVLSSSNQNSILDFSIKFNEANIIYTTLGANSDSGYQNKIYIYNTKLKTHKLIDSSRNYIQIVDIRSSGNIFYFQRDSLLYKYDIGLKKKSLFIDSIKSNYFYISENHLYMVYNQSYQNDSYLIKINDNSKIILPFPFKIFTPDNKLILTKDYYKNNYVFFDPETNSQQSLNDFDYAKYISRYKIEIEKESKADWKVTITDNITKQINFKYYIYEEGDEASYYFKQSMDGNHFFLLIYIFENGIWNMGTHHTKFYFIDSELNKIKEVDIATLISLSEHYDFESMFSADGNKFYFVPNQGSIRFIKWEDIDF